MITKDETCDEIEQSPLIIVPVNHTESKSLYRVHHLSSVRSISSRIRTSSVFNVSSLLLCIFELESKGKIRVGLGRHAQYGSNKVCFNLLLAQLFLRYY